MRVQEACHFEHARINTCAHTHARAHTQLRLRADTDLANDAILEDICLVIGLDYACPWAPREQFIWIQVQVRNGLVRVWYGSIRVWYGSAQVCTGAVRVGTGRYRCGTGRLFSMTSHNALKCETGLILAKAAAMHINANLESSCLARPLLPRVLQRVENV